jgi:hypothetical protein
MSGFLRSPMRIVLNCNVYTEEVPRLCARANIGSREEVHPFVRVSRKTCLYFFSRGHLHRIKVHRSELFSRSDQHA